MIRKFSYVTASMALKTVADELALSPLGSELIHLDDAYHRVLAQAITSPQTLPRYDMSHFDGYAIQARDTEHASVQNPIHLAVIDTLYPGQTPTGSIHSGEACYVTTGSFLPAGADAVVAVEATKTLDNGRIELRAPVELHAHVIPQGSDVEHGETVFQQGHRMRAQDLNLLAALGILQLAVVKKPCVAVICVGDELTDEIGETVDGQILNTHRYAMTAMIHASGGQTKYLGIAADNETAIQKKIGEAVDHTDVVLIVGGSSMGRKDVTAEAINSMGAPGMLVHGIKRKPGRVSGFAVIHDTPIVLLPGLSHSLVVGFYTLVRPLLLALSGRPMTDAEWVVPARMTQPIQFSSFRPFEQVTLVTVRRTPAGYQADPQRGYSSSYHALTRANAFIITPPHTPSVQVDDVVDAHLLPGLFSMDTIFATSSSTGDERVE